MKREINLEVNLGPLTLKNPVMTASGTFGYGEEFTPFLDLNHLGGFVVKGLSLRPRPGNPPPRSCETPSGMLNSIGLENCGIDAFLGDKLPRIRKYNCAIVANIFGETLEEYVAVARKAEGAEGLAALELNISCPNTARGGLDFGCDTNSTREVVRAVRDVNSLPLMVKLAPNVTDIRPLAEAAQQGGADILTLVNTYLGMAVDVVKRRPKLATRYGGLSGPAIRPLAVYQIDRVRSAVDLPLIGMGGILSTEDALEFFLVGASAIQIGTANFVDPRSSIRILEGIRDYLQRENIPDFRALIGALPR
ncbi:MAG: dihydroorotate dehydrogenase [Acidobacteriota bacterium]